MKKIICIFSVMAAAIFMFADVPALYAESAKQQANIINNAGQSSRTSSDEKSRAINNEAWHGSKESSSSQITEGTPEIISKPALKRNDNTETQSFAVSESENVTPWQGLIQAITWIFLAVSSFILFISMSIKRVQVDPASQNTIGAIAAAISFLMAAACATALALSLIIMIKYKQYKLGGILAGFSALGILECSLIGYGCIDIAKNGFASLSLGDVANNLNQLAAAMFAMNMFLLILAVGFYMWK